MNKKRNPIKLERFEQLWEVTKDTYVDCVCPICNKQYKSRAESKRKRTVDDFLWCKTCLTKKTNKQKYGVENVGQLEKTRNINKSRDKEFYQEREIKRRKNNLIKYGVEYPQQLEEVKQKQKQTILEKYGVDNIFKDKEYIKQCCINKFGRENYFAGEQGIRLAEEAMLKKHGVRRALEKEEFKEKAKQTSLERYGVENYGSTEEHTMKMQETNLKKFGTIHAPSYNYVYENLSFDSSWELAFWIYCKDNNIEIEREPLSLPYIFENSECHYIPDFRINKTTLIEIKGNYFLDEDNNLKNVFDGENVNKTEAKNKCLQENNVTIITSPEIYKYTSYVDETYGKNYIKQFRKK